MTIEQIRSRLKFSTPNGMRPIWNRIHQGVQFPDKFAEIPHELAIALLKEYAVSRNGRDGSVILAAKEMISEIGAKAAAEQQVREAAEQEAAQIKALAPTPDPVTPTPAPQHAGPLAGVIEGITALDAVTYLSVVVFGMAVTDLFGHAGYVLTAIFAIFLTTALRTAKDRKRRDAVGSALFFVFFLELFAFMADFSLFYRHLISLQPHLPWGRTQDVYWYTAFACGVLLCASSVYSIYMRSVITRAVADADDFALRHGQAY